MAIIRTHITTMLIIIHPLPIRNQHIMVIPNSSSSSLYPLPHKRKPIHRKHNNLHLRPSNNRQPTPKIHPPQPPTTRRIPAMHPPKNVFRRMKHGTSNTTSSSNSAPSTTTSTSPKHTRKTNPSGNGWANSASSTKSTCRTYPSRPNPNERLVP